MKRLFLALGVGHDSHRLHVVLRFLALCGDLQALDLGQLQLAGLSCEYDLAILLVGNRAPGKFTRRSSREELTLAAFSTRGGSEAHPLWRETASGCSSAAVASIITAGIIPAGLEMMDAVAEAKVW